MDSACSGRNGNHAQQRHLKTTARIRGQRQVALADEGDLVDQLQQFAVHLPGQGCEVGRVNALPLHRLGVDLVQGQVVQGGQDFIQRGAEIHRAHRHGGHRLQRFGPLPHADLTQQLVGELVVYHAQHGANFFGAHFAVAEGDALVEQAQRVARAAVGGARQNQQRRRIVVNAFGFKNFFQQRGQAADVHGFQVELDAARQDGGREFLRVGGGEQELDVFGGFFEGLEQRVEAVGGEHMDFVYEVDLEAPLGRGVLHVVEQFAGVVHLGARTRRPLQ